MPRIIISADEDTLSSGIGNSTTVNNARFVRVYNNSGGDVVLYTQDSNYSGIGSITIKNGSVETIEKHSQDTIYQISGGSIKVARVGVSA